MTTTTMHFGPEWMRAKSQTPARHQPPPSPPLQAVLATQQLGASTYSALVTPVTQELDKRDESRPFRYTKEEMLRIYKEGGGRGGLNLEVERWEGIVRDVGNEPVGLREMNEVEKKVRQHFSVSCLVVHSHEASSFSPGLLIPNFVDVNQQT